jgi:4-hydroxybenzoyl-CoA thioesterase
MIKRHRSTFRKKESIRFSHCDPAGIVYFPQYLVLTNWLVEDWFNEGLGIDFSKMCDSRRLGIPIVKLECEFLKPSRLGDQLDWSLGVTRLGKRSLTLDILASGQDGVRLRSTQVLVMTALATGSSIDFPGDIRRILESAILNAETTCVEFEKC